MWGGGLHWSMTERAWCGLFWAAKDGRVYLRHEFTWRNTPPDLAAADLALTLRRLERERIMRRSIQRPSGVTLEEDRTSDGRVSIFAQPELWDDKAHGETIAETFLNAGVSLRRGDAGMHGFARLRSWLALRDWPDGTRGPLLTVHSSCRVLIQALPTLVASARNPDDVDLVPESYPARGASYFAMSRPMPRREVEPDLPENAIGHLVNELRAAARERNW